MENQPSKIVRKSIVENVKNFAADQDNNQKINVAISVALELYRVLVSSLLILFVPQDCGNGNLCTMTENMNSDSKLYTTGLFFNFATLSVFILMYYFEVKRENKLITYLDVNKSTASDNDSVGKELANLPGEKRTNILLFDKYYQKTAYIAMGTFVINSIISGIVVYNYSLGNQTTTTIITNILFMVSKLGDVYVTVNTEQNIFYSAYLKGKIQYNGVDPDKLTVLEMVDIESPRPDQVEQVRQVELEQVKEEETEPEQIVEPGPLPVQEQIVEPVQEQIVEPVQEQIVEPVQEQIVEPVQEQIVEPVQEQIVELVPVQEQIIELVPVQEQIIEPGPVEKLIEELVAKVEES
jgi:cytochrome b subunit of formate dehydrogenase